VRTPSRSELHSVINLGQQTPYGTVLLRAFGDPKLNAEDLHAYEAGWRWRPYRTLSFDVAVYRHRYEHLISGSPLPQVVEYEPAPALVLPAVFANIDRTVHVDGLEVVAEWAPSHWLYLQAQGTFQDSEYTFGGFQPGLIDPKRMLTLRSQVELPYDLEFDASWRSISELPGQGVAAYESLDARIAWHANDALEISFGGENLLNDEHREFGDGMSLLPGTRMGRSVYARFVWRPGPLR
jgi:iron complex outermembrane receptor protein